MAQESLPAPALELVPPVAQEAAPAAPAPFQRFPINLELENSPVAFECNTREQYEAICANVEPQVAGWNSLHQIHIAANESLFLREQHAYRYFGKHKGKNFLVVGAGPSMRKGLDQVVEAVNRKEWVVIAVDNAVKTLAANRIKPDYAIAFDPQNAVANFYTDLGSTPWFLRISCGPQFVKMVPPKRRVWYGIANPFASIWRETWRKYGALNCLREFAIVTFTAADLAYKMGAANIVTIGNDLTYELPLLCEHCGGFPLKEVLHNLSPGEEIIINPSVGVATTTAFQRAATGFVEMAKGYRDCNFYDIIFPGCLAKNHWKPIRLLKEVV